MLDISIIFVYYKTPSELMDSLNSLSQAIGKLNYEIFIVDNNSPIPLPSEVKKFKHVKIVNSKKNLGYGGGMNLAAKKAKGKYLLITNPDLTYIKNSIKNIVERMDQDSKIGIIGPQILDSKGNIQLVGNGWPFLPDALFVFSFINRLFPDNYFSKKYFIKDMDRKHEREIETICGACMLFRRSVFNHVQGFDQRFFLYFEETDICYRVKKAGYKVLFYPKARIIHLVSRSMSDKKFIQKEFEKSRFKFFKKYHGTFNAVLAEIFLRSTNRISFYIKH